MRDFGRNLIFPHDHIDPPQGPDYTPQTADGGARCACGHMRGQHAYDNAVHRACFAKGCGCDRFRDMREFEERRRLEDDERQEAA